MYTAEHCHSPFLHILRGNDNMDTCFSVNKKKKWSNAHKRVRKCVSNGEAHSVLAGTGSLRPGSASVELLVTRDKFPPDPQSPQDLESAFQPPLTLTQGFLYFPQVRFFLKIEDDRSCFLMFLHTSLEDQKWFLFLMLRSAYHVLNNLENRRLSPSEQPCQGQSQG